MSSIEKLKELDAEMEKALPIDINKAVVMSGKYIGALRKIVEEQEARIQQLENYKGVCIGNGIWPVDTGGKMKDV